LTLAPGPRVAIGDDVVVAGDVHSPDHRVPTVMVGIVRADGTPVYGVGTDMDGVAPTRVAPDRFTYRLALPQLALLPGKYHVRAHALDPEGVRVFDMVETDLTVTGDARELGLVRLAHVWGGDDAAVH